MLKNTPKIDFFIVVNQKNFKISENTPERLFDCCKPKNLKMGKNQKIKYFDNVSTYVTPQ